MRVFSFFLTALLVIVVLLCLLVLFYYYSPHVNMMTAGLNKEEIGKRAMPFLVLSAIYLASSSLSLFFIVKKRYATNAIFAGLMLLAFVITLIFF